MDFLAKLQSLRKTIEYTINDVTFEVEVRALPVSIYREIAKCITSETGDPDSLAVLHGVYVPGTDNKLFSSIADIHNTDQSFITDVSAEVFEISTTQLSEKKSKTIR